MKDCCEKCVGMGDCRGTKRDCECHAPLTQTERECCNYDTDKDGDEFHKPGCTMFAQRSDWRESWPKMWADFTNHIRTNEEVMAFFEAELSHREEEVRRATIAEVEKTIDNEPLGTDVYKDRDHIAAILSRLQGK